MTPLTTKAAEIRAGLGSAEQMASELRNAAAFEGLGTVYSVLDRAADLIEQQAAELAAKDEQIKETAQEAHDAVLSMIFMPGVRKALDGLPEDDPVEPYLKRIRDLEAAESERDELLREKERLEKERDEAREALIECEGYFDNRADADCDQDGFVPNKEMRLLAVVREAIASTSQDSGQNLADANSKSPSPSSQSERIAVLEAALRPFADVADVDEETGRDDPDDDRILVVQAYGCQLAELSTEDFRRARAALAPLGEE